MTTGAVASCELLTTLLLSSVLTRIRYTFSPKLERIENPLYSANCVVCQDLLALLFPLLNNTWQVESHCKRE